MKQRMSLSCQTFLSKFTGLQKGYYEELPYASSQKLEAKHIQPKMLSIVNYPTEYGIQNAKIL